MKNPYSNALQLAGMTTLGLTLFALIIGVAWGQGGGFMLGAASYLFPVGAVSLIGWLIVEGLRWKPPVKV